MPKKIKWTNKSFEEALNAKYEDLPYMRVNRHKGPQGEFEVSLAFEALDVICSDLESFKMNVVGNLELLVGELMEDIQALDPTLTKDYYMELLPDLSTLEKEEITKDENNSTDK